MPGASCSLRPTAHAVTCKKDSARANSTDWGVPSSTSWRPDSFFMLPSATLISDSPSLLTTNPPHQGSLDRAKTRHSLTYQIPCAKSYVSVCMPSCNQPLFVLPSEAPMFCSRGSKGLRFRRNPREAPITSGCRGSELGETREPDCSLAHATALPLSAADCPG